MIQSMIQSLLLLCTCVPGADEGCAAFLGATASLAASGCCCLVFDMGGRSTEFAVGEHDTAMFYLFVPV